jgi:tetratricopeptide (TPR) repeat protein
MADAAFLELLDELSLATSEGGRAVRKALATLEDGGAAWVEAAAVRLRQALAGGEVSDVDKLARAILAVRWAHGSAAVDVRVAREHPGLLVKGIQAVVASAPAPPQLLDVLSDSQTDPSYRWAAQLWLAVSAACSGDAESALRQAGQARAISGPLDPHTRFTTQLLHSYFCSLAGQHDRARAELATAIELLEAIDDRRDRSSAWLDLAKVLLGLGGDRDALRAARQAVTSADPRLPAAVVFLARRAVMDGHLEEASILLGEAPTGKVAELEMGLVNHVRLQLIPLSTACECYWLLQLPVVGDIVSHLLDFAHEHRSSPHLVARIAWHLALAGHTREAVQLFHTLLSTADVEVVRLARDGLSQIGHGRRVGAIDLLLHRTDAGGAGLLMSADPELFWSRCATMDGRLDTSWELLERAAADTSSGIRLEEIRREKRLIDQTRRGTLPHSVVSEFLWIRERPLTDRVVAQLAEFVDEHRAATTLRELLAWDLAVAGIDAEARRQFRSIALAEAAADSELRRSVELGLAFLGDEVSTLSPSIPARAAAPREPTSGAESRRGGRKMVVVAGSEERASTFASVLRGEVDTIVGRPRALPPHLLLVCEGSLLPPRAVLEAAAQVFVILPALDLETVSACLKDGKVRHLAAYPSWRNTLRDLAKKLATGDTLGMRRYLPASVTVHRRDLSTYQDRCRALEDVESYARRSRTSGFVRRIGVQVAEELLMNAMYHAPVDERGRRVFEDVEPGARVHMTTPAPVSLDYAVHDGALHVAVRDRFGSFDPSALASSLHRCVTQREQIEAKKLGAGLGLYLILSGASRLTINLFPGRLSEFIAVIEPQKELGLTSLSIVVG